MQRSYLKHTILWVNNAGCDRAVPAYSCGLTCRQGSFEVLVKHSKQSTAGTWTTECTGVEETAVEAEDNNLPAAKLAHLDKSIHLELGCLLCSLGEGCCGQPWVQISPTVKLSCVYRSKQKAEMSICGFIPVCLYPSLLQTQGWE